MLKWLVAEEVGDVLFLLNLLLLLNLHGRKKPDVVPLVMMIQLLVT